MWQARCDRLGTGWNKKYSGKISLWSGASTNFEVAALKLGFPKMDNLTTSQVAAAKASLLQQKPLNKLYWESEYSQMQPDVKSGTVWISYSWQDTLVSMKAAGVPVAFLNPSQGRLSWLCGFMLGANTKNYYHASFYPFAVSHRLSLTGQSGWLIKPPMCACHMAQPLYIGATVTGREVHWLEINGPRASSQLLTSLLAELPGT
ncbi:MAG TPA: hypothetical protein VMU94_01980 [Streptosporangiaceae bacterium]|nr:hypothetical protein [Streptosporangiaceae bacterium]